MSKDSNRQMKYRLRKNSSGFTHLNGWYKDASIKDIIIEKS